MKPAFLRPQAEADQDEQVRYYRSKAGVSVTRKLVLAFDASLNELERSPGIGSPLLGEELDIAGLRTWTLTGFPLLWVYFERDDHLDVVRLLEQRQDIIAVLGGPG